MVLLIPVLIAGRGFYLRGYPALFRGSPSMDSLAALGTTVAAGYSVYCTICIWNGDTSMADRL